jgi:hypothetical protein
MIFKRAASARIAAVFLACASLLPWPAMAQQITGYQVTDGITGAQISQPDSVTTPHPVTCITGCASATPWTPDASGGAAIAPATLTLSTPNTAARMALPGAGSTARITVSNGYAQCRFGSNSVVALAGDTTFVGGMRLPAGVPSGSADISCVSPVVTTVTVETGTGAAYPEMATDLTASGAVTQSGAWNMGLAPTATGGCTPGGMVTTASTNATSVKASAGTFCGGHAVNTTATVANLRWYNLSTAPTCSSATGYVTTTPIPANTAGAGLLLDWGTYGAAFTTGIAWCVTGGPTSTDATNAVAGVYINYATK